MKYILFSDLHLGIHGSSEIWLEASIKLIKEIIETCKKEKIDKIFFLGDFCNDRRSLNLKTLWTAIEIGNLIEESQIDLYLILGNHDLYLKNSLEPHSLKIFEPYKYIHIVDKITEIDEFCTLVPWNTVWKEAETPYLFGHFEINGFDIESGDNAFEFNVSDFKRYSKVFSGHFHNPKTIRNIEYIGSCMGFSMHDVDSPRGYYILEIENNKKCLEHFIEFTQSPKYKIIFSNEEIKEEDIKGNVVKLVYVDELSSVANEELMTKLTALNPVSIQSDFKNIILDEIIENDDKTPRVVKDSITLLYEYLEKSTVPDHINKDMVKKFIKQLLKDDLKNE